MTTDKRYLDWVEGDNTVWATGIKVTRAGPDQNGVFKRGKLTVLFCEKSSAETHESAFTNFDIYLPKQDDLPGTRIMMDRKIKMVLFPLAELALDAKVKLSELVGILQLRFQEADFQCTATVKLVPGNSVGQDGNVRTFAEFVAFAPIAASAKKGYESSIELDEIPF